MTLPDLSSLNASARAIWLWEKDEWGIDEVDGALRTFMPESGEDTTDIFSPFALMLKGFKLRELEPGEGLRSEG